MKSVWKENGQHYPLRKINFVKKFCAVLKLRRMRNQQKLYACAAIFLMIICLELYHFFSQPSPLQLFEGGEQTIAIPMRQAMSGDVHLREDDERVIKYILDEGLLVPPVSSAIPYNLSKPNEDSAQPPGTVIRTVLRELNITSGFYVECGAFDGEYLSNSLYLERELGWKGLLVEGNPINYERLKSKNRKAWLSKTCLSSHPYPHRAHADKNNEVSKIKESGNGEQETQCVPFYTLLSAIKVNTVDYFSLDVEGSEFQVLETIPFDKIFIKTMTVEYAHSDFKHQILKFVEGKGYVEVGKTKFPENWRNHDYMFVHESLINKKE